MENRLIGRPHFPKVHGPQGTSFLPKRRMTRSVIGRRYDVKWPINEREVMALKALVEPMLTRPSKAAMMVMRMIARIGIW